MLYVYGVLHDPVYREKYALNLKHEFPCIPFYPDFWQWADWGEQLMALHIGYEAIEPFPLNRVDVPDEKARKAGQTPSGLLKNSRRPRCQRHGPGCKAPRRRRCRSTSSRSGNTAGGAVPRQPFGRKGLGAICVVADPRKGIHPVVVSAPGSWPRDA